MKIFGIVLSLTVIAFGGIIACSSSDSSIVQAPKVQVPDEPFTHDRFNTVLNTYVDDAGMVNYKGLKENRTPLDQYVAHMGAVANETYKAWSKDEQMAFWINEFQFYHGNLAD